MGSKRLALHRRLVQALDFAADSWRGAWAVQLLFAAGLGMAVAGGLADGPDSQWLAIGVAVCLVAWAPLFSALHQIQRLVPDERDLGLWGLQVGSAELALWIVAASIAALCALAGFVGIAILTVTLVALRRLGEIALGPLGEVRIAAVAAFGWLLAGTGAGLWVLARLSLAWGMTVDSQPHALIRSWVASRDRGLRLLLAGFWAWTPTLFLALAAVALDRLGSTPGHWRWPWPDAGLMGLCAGLVGGFIQAPLLVGLIGGFERRSAASISHRRATSRSLLPASSL